MAEATDDLTFSLRVRREAARVLLDALDQQGIYPMSVTGGEHAYAERSDFKNGWNAASIDTLNRVTDILAALGHHATPREADEDTELYKRIRSAVEDIERGNHYYDNTAMIVNAVVDWLEARGRALHGESMFEPIEEGDATA
jgi:hypothetical protein